MLEDQLNGESKTIRAQVDSSIHMHNTPMINESINDQANQSRVQASSDEIAGMVKGSAALFVHRIWISAMLKEEFDNLNVGSLASHHQASFSPFVLLVHISSTSNKIIAHI